MAAAWLLTAPAALAASEPADKYGENTPLDLPAESPAKTAESIGGGGGSIVRTLVGLAVVVAVIYGVAHVLKWMKQSKEERTSGFGLSSEAVVPLGPNRSVHLIRAGSELVLVGSAEQGVVPIRTYTEDEARRVGLLRDEDRPVPGTDLAAPRKRSLLDIVKERTAR